MSQDPRVPQVPNIPKEILIPCVLLLVTVPNYAVPYLGRLLFDWGFSTAAMVGLGLVVADTALGLVAFALKRIAEPVYLTMSAFLGALASVWYGARVEPSRGLTFLACLCLLWVLKQWVQNPRSLWERTWGIRRALRSGTPSQKEWARERARFYNALDEFVLRFGYVRTGPSDLEDLAHGTSPDPDQRPR